jgi:cysteine desulfurase / selenocysteine lyase
MTTPIPREEFPVLERWVPLDHAGVAPLPRSVTAAIGRYVQNATANGSATVDKRLQEVEEIRARCAAFLGAGTSEVAFVTNTTEGLSFVAGGLDWQPGDKVVVPACEFPSTHLPWDALADRGVEVISVAPVSDIQALPLDAFDAALQTGQVRVVVTSWVQFGRGWRVDLESLARLCHQHDALLCADIIQGLGAIPLHLASTGVDFAAADAHKWLLGPEGIGLLYVADRNTDLLRPLEPGWNSMVHRGDWNNPRLDWDPSARRFEGGTHNIGGIFGLGAAVDLIVAAGTDKVWSHIDGLTRHLTTELDRMGLHVSRARDARARSGIVSFGVPGQAPEDICAALRAEGILSAPRAGRVRLSPHGYNDTGDIEHVLDALAKFRTTPCQRVPASPARQPRRLLDMFAHQDDEVLRTGGTLAAATANGRHATVVSATRGEAGDVHVGSEGDDDIGLPIVEDPLAVRSQPCRIVDAHGTVGLVEHDGLVHSESPAALVDQR